MNLFQSSVNLPQRDRVMKRKPVPLSLKAVLQARHKDKKHRAFVKSMLKESIKRLHFLNRKLCKVNEPVELTRKRVARIYRAIKEELGI